MDKEIVAKINLIILGGQATPAPPVGPALGQKKVNIAEFCKQFNAVTKDKMGQPLPVVISVYKDNSFSFVVKQPPVTYLIKKIAKIDSCSKTPGLGAPVAVIKKKDFADAIRQKMPDLNCFGDENSALKMFIGSARSMGIKVED